MSRTRISLTPERPPARKSPACKDLQLRLSRSLSASARQKILQATRGLPALTGSPICVRVLPLLTAHRGKLLSGVRDRGTPVHAASFIRKREIVLESELLGKAALPAITVHEIFHFVWARLGNPKRSEYGAILALERENRARGELGESSAVHKDSGPWRDYVCESFCDTAAWLYAPGAKRGLITLGQRWRARRQAWFLTTFASAGKC